MITEDELKRIEEIMKTWLPGMTKDNLAHTVLELVDEIRRLNAAYAGVLTAVRTYGARGSWWYERELIEFFEPGEWEKKRGKIK